MSEYQVTCITKPNVESRHEYITHIGNSAGNWRLTREAVIRRIDSGKEVFFVVDSRAANRAYIAVVRELGKSPYLRTHADGSWTDNLLSLPQCGGLPVVE